MDKFKRLPKELKTKHCLQCGVSFSKNKDWGNKQWLDLKYCSRNCFAIANTGHEVSDETIKKISDSNKGKLISKETRLKMSISRLGKSPVNKGIPMSDEAKLKLSIANKGKESAMKGKKHTIEAKEKNRLAHIGKTAWNKGLKGYFAGKLNNMWKGGISKLHKTERQLAMETVEYKEWRKSVFERDNYTCQECGQVSGKLNADHIKPWRDYPELRYELSNGRTLCIECHKNVGWSLFRELNPMKNKSIGLLNNI